MSRTQKHFTILHHSVFLLLLPISYQMWHQRVFTMRYYMGLHCPDNQDFIASEMLPSVLQLYLQATVYPSCWKGKYVLQVWPRLCVEFCFPFSLQTTFFSVYTYSQSLWGLFMFFFSFLSKLGFSRFHPPLVFLEVPFLEAACFVNIFMVV